MSADNAAKRFADTFNRHGYGLPQVVIDQIHNLFQETKAGWRFETVEFPVRVQDESTRIDIILSGVRGSWLIVGECKRVNPAIGNWYFVRSRYVRRNHHEYYIAENAKMIETSFFSDGLAIGQVSDEFYHIALEVKTDADGDKSGGKDAIEDACGQVMKGVNGLIDSLRHNIPLLGASGAKVILPVIFTTAKLFAGEFDWKDVDGASGKVDASKVRVTEKPYLFYQYPVSPGIRHSAISSETHSDFSAVMVADHLRTIAVVSISGIATFFERFHPLNFDILKISP